MKLARFLCARLRLAQKALAVRSWSTKDITSVVKPPGVGWIGPGFSGAQLASGRLSICIDFIDGQWASYPINHSRSTTVYSDDHGASWHWSAGASPDGDRMNECSVADLPNVSRRHPNRCTQC